MLMKDTDLQKLLDGVEDVITLAVNARRERFANLKCPACGGAVHPEFDIRDLRRLRADEVIPPGRARCGSCGRLYDPDTGLVIERGRLANLLEPGVPIIGEDDNI